MPEPREKTGLTDVGSRDGARRTDSVGLDLSARLFDNLVDRHRVNPATDLTHLAKADSHHIGHIGWFLSRAEEEFHASRIKGVEGEQRLIQAYREVDDFAV